MKGKSVLGFLLRKQKTASTIGRLTNRVFKESGFHSCQVYKPLVNFGIRYMKEDKLSDI